MHKALDAIHKKALECNEYCIAPARTDSTALETSTECATRVDDGTVHDEGCSARPSSEGFGSQAETVYEASEELSLVEKAAHPQPKAQPEAQLEVQLEVQLEAELEAQPAASFGLQYLWDALFGLLYWAWLFNDVGGRRETQTVTA